MPSVSSSPEKKETMPPKHPKIVRFFNSDDEEVQVENIPKEHAKNWYRWIKWKFERLGKISRSTFHHWNQDRNNDEEE